MHSKSKRGGDGGRSDRESRDKNADVPPRSMERMRQHSNSRVDQKGVGRDHGGQHRRGHSEWDRRGDRPSTGRRGHERSARGEDRERPSGSRRDASDAEALVTFLVRCDRGIPIMTGSMG